MHVIPQDRDYPALIGYPGLTRGPWADEFTWALQLIYDETQLGHHVIVMKHKAEMTIDYSTERLVD